MTAVQVAKAVFCFTGTTLTGCSKVEQYMAHSKAVLCVYRPRLLSEGCLAAVQVAMAVFCFRGTVMTKRSNFAADIDVWRNANRDLYFAARAVKHIRLEMAQLQRQYPGVQWGFFCTGKEKNKKGLCVLTQAMFLCPASKRMS